MSKAASAIDAAALLAGSPAAAQPAKPDEAAFRSLYKELVETNTAFPNGSCTEAGQKMAARLKAAGSTFGVSGIFSDPDLGRIHGLNERIRVKSVMEGREFLYRLVKTYAEQAG